ncbi:hypothetical protein RRG08_040736 [Elysia crispata]|uniref:Uncharacterized protein n=1 Tax=Elysia crispata TaxID=231223 RepID=A0AAE1BE14_9GAST|nr:hypothetical protein RRG08_040736 [Elysia crispata]
MLALLCIGDSRCFDNPQRVVLRIFSKDLLKTNALCSARRVSMVLMLRPDFRAVDTLRISLRCSYSSLADITPAVGGEALLLWAAVPMGPHIYWGTQTLLNVTRAHELRASD